MTEDEFEAPSLPDDKNPSDSSENIERASEDSQHPAEQSADNEITPVSDFIPAILGPNDIDPIIVEPADDTYGNASLAENLVSKSNSLIRASYKLNLQEQRLILAAISKIDSRKLNHYPGKPNQATVHISAQEFADTFGISNKKAYEELKEAADNLFERKILEIDGKKSTKMRWVSKVTYHDGLGWAEITFSNDIIPHLTFLREKFTSYKLNRITSLKSGYSVRVFELCVQYQATGMLRITLEDFINDLNLPYQRFSDIKRRVIEPAIEELKVKSNMDITWRAISQKRKVYSLEFVFTEAAQSKLDLNDPQDPQSPDAPPAP